MYERVKDAADHARTLPRAGHARRLLLTTLCLCSSAQAQLPYVGVLSAVDIGAKPGAATEAGRTSGLTTTLPGSTQKVMPLVELIHVQNFVACQKRSAAGQQKVGSLQSGSASSCAQYEWSVPFIPQANALKLEEALSRAWNEFDARSTWYMNALLDTNPLPSTLGSSCAAIGQLDLYLNAWKSTSPVSAINPAVFCKEVTSGTASSTPSYVLGKQCGEVEAYTNWAEVSRRWAAGYRQALAVYYPQYWKQVYAAMAKYMPGSLSWDGVYPLTGPAGTVGGTQLQPVYTPSPQPAIYQALSLTAQSQAAGGAQYMLKHYPYTSTGGLKVPGGALAVPDTATGSGLGATWPGISSLEVLKYSLANREDIFKRSNQWASLDPKAGPTPQGQTGAGDLRETEGVGAVSFLQLYGRVDQLSSPRTVEYKRWCLLGLFPFLNTRTLPNIASTINASLGGLTRVHVRWETVPEGYPLHNVRGQPRHGLPSLDSLTGLMPTFELPTVDVSKLPSAQVLDKAKEMATSTATSAADTLKNAAAATTAKLPNTAQAVTGTTNGSAVPKTTQGSGSAATTTVPAASKTGNTSTGTSKPATTTPASTTKIQPTKIGTPQKTEDITYSTYKVPVSAKTATYPNTFQDTVSTQTTTAATAKTVVTGCEKVTGTEAIRKCLAMKVLKTSRISLSDVSTTTGGSAEQNMVDTAKGLAPMRGCGPNSQNCGQRQTLSIRLLEKMLQLAQNHQYVVTAITGGGHDPASSHYTGEAIDLGTFDGVYLGTANKAGHRSALNACLSAGSRKSQTFNVDNEANHSDHVHCDFRAE